MAAGTSTGQVNQANNSNKYELFFLNNDNCQLSTAGHQSILLICVFSIGLSSALFVAGVNLPEISWLTKWHCYQKKLRP